MSITYRVVTGTIYGLTRILCRIDSEALKQVPMNGPLILVGNHINFLEAPVMYTQLQPRPVTAFVKAETWNNPVLGPLVTLVGCIPIQRDEIDLTALRAGLKALESGYILAIAPEGTRSGDGRLAQGHPGMVTMALRSGARILPVVYYGGEMFHQNYRRLRRTDFSIRVGRPFNIDLRGHRVNSDLRRKITDEIMYQMSALLPPEYRGVYADLDRASSEHLRF